MNADYSPHPGPRLKSRLKWGKICGLPPASGVLGDPHYMTRSAGILPASSSAGCRLEGGATKYRYRTWVSPRTPRSCLPPRERQTAGRLASGATPPKLEGRHSCCPLSVLRHASPDFSPHPGNNCRRVAGATRGDGNAGESPALQGGMGMPASRWRYKGERTRGPYCDRRVV